MLYHAAAQYQASGQILSEPPRAGVVASKPEMNGTTADVIVTAIPMGQQWMTSLSYQFDTPRLPVG